MHLVHSLAGPPLEAAVVGLRGARLGGLVSLDLPIAPGFAIGTAAWHLERLLGDGGGLSETLSEQVRGALAALDGEPPLSVRPAPAAGVDASLPAIAVGLPGTPTQDRPALLEDAVRSLLRAASSPTAVIVQAHIDAGGRWPCGNGTAFTRNPVRASVWPKGVFRTRGSIVDLETFNRRLPALGVELRIGLARVESLYRALCRVDFTVEAGRLWFDDAQPWHHSDRADGQLADAGLVEPPPPSRRPAPAPGSGG